MAMPPVVIDLNSAEDPRDVVHRAVQALAEEKLVAFPTETVYGLAASARSESAIARLVEATQRQPTDRVALAIKSVDDVLDYVPDIPPLGLRLARRCWPGPVTLVLDDEHPDSLVKRLPATVQQAVTRDGSVALCVPAHRVLLSVLRLSAGPLALASVPCGNEGAEAVTAQEVLAAAGDRVELVLDDGPSKFGQPPSVVRVKEQGLAIVRSGVVGEDTLRRLSCFMVLMVCTGNTCRSPMAEVLMRQRLARALGCSLEELEDHGVMVMSAGIAAMAGGRSAAEAIETVRQRGLDLSQHESQPLNDRLVRFADLILTMTRGHREAILAQWPEAAARTRLLSRDGSDIADPIGGPPELYERCARQIDAQLEGWLGDPDLLSILPSDDSGV